MNFVNLAKSFKKYDFFSKVSTVSHRLYVKVQLCLVTRIGPGLAQVQHKKAANDA